MKDACFALYFKSMHIFQRAMAGLGWDQNELLLGQLPTLGLRVCMWVQLKSLVKAMHSFQRGVCIMRDRVLERGAYDKTLGEGERRKSACMSCF